MSLGLNNYERLEEPKGKTPRRKLTYVALGLGAAGAIYFAFTQQGCNTSENGDFSRLSHTINIDRS